MSEADFFRDEAKQATMASVRRVELQTSAELVVSVRPRSGRYGVLAYHSGLSFALVVVAYLLVAPQVYSVAAIALNGVLAFALAALLAANLHTVLRLLSRPSTLDANVNRAARAAFYDLGISRTTGRNGFLVYVSLFERRCVLLTDIGIDPSALGAGWPDAQHALLLAVQARSLSDFRSALESLGPVLAAAHPRSHGDVNELPDEVR